MTREQQFNECHTFRHAWKVLEIERDGKVYAVRLICMRCRSQAEDNLGEAGGRIRKRKYSYAPGYLLGREEEKPTIDDYRIRLIQSMESLSKKRRKR